MWFINVDSSSLIPQCGNFWFEDAYDLYLRDKHLELVEDSLVRRQVRGTDVEVVQDAHVTVVQGIQQASGDVKMLALDVKLQLADIKLNIGHLRTEIKDLKDEVKKGKNPIVIDNAVPVVLVLVVFVAVLLAIVWKK